MQLNTADREVLKSGVGEETTFSIKATGKAFQILSSGLYSNKILAIVRELSCNAYDAHVAAGKKDVPIEIYLPNTLKPTFVVKDFGTGLSDFQIRGGYVDSNGKEYSLEDGQGRGFILKGGLYNTYFDSTKQDSNEFIGALGLGSKSPFSYVSNFIVESRYNGVKSTYSAFINEKHLPSITKIGSVPTDELNGLTITLSVKQGDHSKFESEARKALMYFDPKPIVKGVGNFEAHALKHTVSGSNWKVRESSYYAGMRGPYVVQGFVAYPIDAEQLESHLSSSVAKSIIRADIDITVPMGDVDVAASRESLSYDVRTVQNLARHLEKIGYDIHASIQKDISACKTLWEVAALTSKIATGTFQYIFHYLHRTKEFKWDGKAIDISHEVGGDYSAIKNTEVARVEVVHSRRTSVYKLATRGTKSPGIAGDLQVRVDQHLKVFVDDVAKGSNAILLDYMKEDDHTQAIVIRPAKNVFDQNEVKAVIKLLGNPVFTYISTLPKVQKEKGSYKKREANQRLRWDGFKTGFNEKKLTDYSRLCWKAETIDLNAGGFYVPIDRFTIMHEGAEFTNFDGFLNNMIAGTILPNKCVYGFNAKEAEAAKNDKKWVNVFDHVKQQFDVVNKANNIISVIVAEQFMTQLSTGFYQQIVKQWNHLSKDINDGEFKTFMDMIVTTTKSKKSGFNYGNVHNSFNTLRLFNLADVDVERDVKKLQTKWQSIIGKMKMISLIDWSRIDRTTIDTVIEYINEVQ